MQTHLGAGAMRRYLARPTLVERITRALVRAFNTAIEHEDARCGLRGLWL